jgi:hypothetical protein
MDSTDSNTPPLQSSTRMLLCNPLLQPKLPPNPNADLDHTDNADNADHAHPKNRSPNVEPTTAALSLPPSNQPELKPCYPNGPASPTQPKSILPTSPSPRPSQPPSCRYAPSIPECDEETTPTIDPLNTMPSVVPFVLPDAALRPPPSQDGGDMASSPSSLYSLGPAVVHAAHSLAGSGPSSIAGSELDCTYSLS